MTPVSLTRPTGQTLYAFPDGHSLADWTTKRVKLDESAAPNLGLYTASLDETLSPLWRIFVGAAQPANWSASIGYFPLQSDTNGSGEFAIVLSVDVGEVVPVAVPNALVTIKQSGTIVAYGNTDAIGAFRVNLSAGNYSYSISASGFTSISNQAFAVTADATIDVSLDRIAAPPAGSPSACRVTLRSTRNVANEQVRVLITSEGASGHEAQRAFVNRAFDGLTDVNGLLVVDLPWSSIPGVGKYRFKLLDRSTSAVLHDRTCTVPNLASADYEDLT